MDLTAFFTTTEGIALLTVIVIAATWYITWLTGLIQWFFDRGKKPEPIIVHTDPIPSGSAGIVKLTVEAYEARLRAREVEVEARILTAVGIERERLINEKTELERRLTNIDTAYAEAKTKIAELETTLARFGNEIGGDRLAEARTALEAGDFSKADEIFAEVRAREQIAVERCAEAAFGQGKIAEEQVRWADATQHYAEAARLAPNYDRLFSARLFFLRTGDFERARAAGVDLIDAASAEFGAESRQYATALNEHAITLRDTDRTDEAEPLFRQALEIGKATIGEAHPDYATWLNNLALLLRATGRTDEAEPLYRQALEIGKATIGEAHPAYATRLNNLAALLNATGRTDEAEPLFRQALEIAKTTLGEGHPDYATNLNNLAALLYATGRTDEAEPLYRQALETRPRRRSATTILTRAPSPTTTPASSANISPMTRPLPTSNPPSAPISGADACPTPRT